jgi:hypothetical protein
MAMGGREKGKREGRRTRERETERERREGERDSTERERWIVSTGADGMTALLRAHNLIRQTLTWLYEKCSSAERMK